MSASCRPIPPVEIKLLEPYYVDRYRNFAIGGDGRRFQRSLATGKAKCRNCGHRIAEGELALVGYHGGWRIWLHETFCTPKL